MDQDSFRQENKKGFNVSHSGDGHIYIQQPGAPVGEPPSVEGAPVGEPSPGEAQKEEGTEGSGCGAATFVLLILVAIVITFFISKCEAEPEPDKPWPPGISRGMILQPIVKKITNCSKEAVLKPRSCLQDASASQPSEIHWLLHGDPVDGAAIKFDGRTFKVHGVAVMTLKYRESRADNYELHIIPYEASVYPESGQLQFGSIATGEKPSPDIAKHQVTADSAEVNLRVREKFDQCLMSKLEPMPPGCPKGSEEGTPGDQLRNLEADPLLNATSEFETQTGITHIRGSYSINTETTDFFGSPVKWIQSGDYDASVIIGNGSIEVLNISHEN